METGVNKLKNYHFHFAFYPKVSSILCYIFGIRNMYVKAS